jgi:hypothetical protein
MQDYMIVHSIKLDCAGGTIIMVKLVDIEGLPEVADKSSKGTPTVCKMWFEPLDLSDITVEHFISAAENGTIIHSESFDVFFSKKRIYDRKMIDSAVYSTV